jgi:hypothetical protein
MNNDFPLIRLIASRIALVAALLAVIAAIMVACHFIGPAWVMIPVTVIALAWSIS